MKTSLLDVAWRGKDTALPPGVILVTDSRGTPARFLLVTLAVCAVQERRKVRWVCASPAMENLKLTLAKFGVREPLLDLVHSSTLDMNAPEEGSLVILEDMSVVSWIHGIDNVTTCARQWLQDAVAAQATIVPVVHIDDEQSMHTFAQVHPFCVLWHQIRPLSFLQGEINIHRGPALYESAVQAKDRDHAVQYTISEDVTYSAKGLAQEFL